MRVRTMVQKAKYNKTAIDNLPNDKPVLYRIETDTGNLNYAGIAKRGRVRDRIKEHLEEMVRPQNLWVTVNG